MRRAIHFSGFPMLTLFLWALVGLALLDVLAGWLLPALTLPALIAVAVYVLRARPGRIRSALLGLAMTCFAVHLGHSLLARYEARAWSDIQAKRATHALSEAVAYFEGRFAEVASLADGLAADVPLRASIRSDNGRETFARLGRAVVSKDEDDEDGGRYLDGVAVRDARGGIEAWAGRLPDYLESATRPESGVAVRRSTALYWIEGHAPIADGGDVIGYVSVFKRIDSVYPLVLPGGAPHTLSERLTERLGHEVRVELGARRDGAFDVARSPWAAASTRDAGRRPGVPEAAAFGAPVWRVSSEERVRGEARAGDGQERPTLSRDVNLPSGERAGAVQVAPRALEDEMMILRRDGLFVASLAALALMIASATALSRQVLGARFSRARAGNLVVFVVLIVGLRIGLAQLRGFLNLPEFASFTSYHYATQITTGVLRSPADLAITSVLGAVALGVVVLVGTRRTRSGASRAVGGRESIPRMVLVALIGTLVGGVALATGELSGRIIGDSRAALLTLSPFDWSAPSVLLRVGIFALVGTLILAGAGLIAFEISLLGGWQRPKQNRIYPVLLTCAPVYGLAGLAATVGFGSSVLVASTACVAGGYVIHRMRRKSLSVGFVGIAIIFGLAASVLQYPNALRDFYDKSREDIESVAARIASRTDEWKTSVLEEALVEILEDPTVAGAVSGATSRLDSEALRLWAGSILGRARVACGVHVLDRNGEEVGRFSLEETGDVSEMEASVRAARFSGKPVRSVVRGTVGSGQASLYVGVVPLTASGAYVGSVVVSMPHQYENLEAIAGLKPTFFDVLGWGLPPGRGTSGYAASLAYGGKIVETTARDFEVGKEIAALDLPSSGEPRWVEHIVGGKTHWSLVVPSGRDGETLLLSFPRLSLGERAVYFMGVVVANVIVAFGMIMIVSLARLLRHVARRIQGRPCPRFRWGFAARLALAFVLIAIAPTLILGGASRRFLQSRLKEVMESRSEEGINLAKLALERLVEGEALRLARNPILIDELNTEPSILSMLVSHDVSAAVIDSSCRMIAAYGEVGLPAGVLASVLETGRSYNSHAVRGGLVATSAVPIRDVIRPETIAGCAIVARDIDDPLARRLSSDLDRDITFYGASGLAASSKRELFVSELMPSTISSEAYLECYVGSREIHFDRERIGGTDLVVGYSPLRGFAGEAVGAVSVPVVFRRDDVGGRMQWTASAISYILVIVIGAVFTLGLLLARRISSPIVQLIQGTLRISSGDLRFTIPKAGDDEIGDLVLSFNKMTEALAKSRSALWERKRYIETIISNVGAGIIATDSRGSIDTWNAAAEQTLGVKAKEARGRDARSLLRRIGAGDLAAMLDEVDASTSMPRREVAFARRDASLATLRAVASAVRGPNRKPMGRVIVFEDVTELIRSKKLIAWSEMAKQVAHEIKNPLTPMKLSAQQLLQAHKDGAPDFDRVLAESVATIVEQIESLRRIAVEFSQFSRMPERNLTVVDINQILEESLAQYETTVASSIRIGKNLDRNLPRVRVDANEIKRVFLNVIENAMQAMPGGGRLDVGSRRGRPGEAQRYRVSVSSRSPYQGRLEDYVEVSFADTGAGISIENSAKLFGHTFSTKTAGTGLGLVICKGIVDAYAGEILIESTEGEGTCVRVRLPAADRAPTGQRFRRRTHRGSRYPRRG